MAFLVEVVVEGGVDGAQEAQTGPSTRGRANERTSGRGNGRTGRSGPPLRRRRVGWTNKRGVRWSGGRGGRADERVGLGLKGHIPRGPLHSWAPSPLASLERERIGCLGVQWGLGRFHVKHPYLAPGLTCLV